MQCSPNSNFKIIGSCECQRHHMKKKKLQKLSIRESNQLLGFSSSFLQNEVLEILPRYENRPYPHLLEWTHLVMEHTYHCDEATNLIIQNVHNVKQYKSQEHHEKKKQRSRKCFSRNNNPLTKKKTNNPKHKIHKFQ